MLDLPVFGAEFCYIQYLVNMSAITVLVSRYFKKQAHRLAINVAVMIRMLPFVVLEVSIPSR